MNWENKTLFVGDNLHVMRGMNSDSVKGKKTQAEFAAIISQRRKDFSWMDK